MAPAENPPVVFKGERKTEFSSISIIVTFLLGITLIVFLQFLVNDLTKSLYGEHPKFALTSYQEDKVWHYGGVSYNNYADARKAFEKAEVLPYETKALTLNTIINAPLFILSIILIFTLGNRKSSYKLATTTYFIAMAVNMLALLTRLAAYIYKINQRLAIYSISGFLIIVFTVSIFYIQEKFRKREAIQSSPGIE